MLHCSTFNCASSLSSPSFLPPPYFPSSLHPSFLRPPSLLHSMLAGMASCVYSHKSSWSRPGSWSRRRVLSPGHHHQNHTVSDGHAHYYCHMIGYFTTSSDYSVAQIMPLKDALIWSIFPNIYVAVLGRNQTLFRCVFRLLPRSKRCSAELPFRAGLIYTT